MDDNGHNKDDTVSGYNGKNAKKGKTPTKGMVKWFSFVN